MENNKIIENLFKCSAFLCVTFVIFGFFLYGTTEKNVNYKDEIQLGDACKTSTSGWSCGTNSWVNSTECNKNYSFDPPNSGITWNKIMYREVNSNVCKNFHSIDDTSCCQVTTCNKVEMCTSCNSGNYLDSGKCKSCPTSKTLKRNGCEGNEDDCCESSSQKTCYEFKDNTCKMVTVSGTTCNESNNQYSTEDACRRKITTTSNCNVENCKTCVSGSTTKCSVCISDYHPSNGSCVHDVTSCPVGQGKNSFGVCENCAAGYWSEEGSTSCATKCPAGYACKNGKKTKCTTPTPEGSSTCSSCPAGMGSDSSTTSGCSRCAAGYYQSGSSYNCSACAAGMWSYAGSGSCTLKCEEGYACKNGTKTKCSVATPEGSGECYTCDVDNCKTCEKYKKDVCATCKSGYSLNGKGKCYWSGGSSTPKDACYKNTTTNEYIWGQYDGQVGYSKLANDQSTCNKVLIKLVDDSGYDLQGAIISVTSSLNPTSPTNYNIGKKELELLAPGTYKIKETAAPTNYQLDTYEIEITVDSLGIVNVKTNSSNVDLGTTNNTRNTTITWKNLAVASTKPPVDDDDEEKCYVKHADAGENEYCYGKKDDCSSYSDELVGRDNKSCKEDVACYTDSTGAYVSGKYTNRDGYKYYAASCPKCYKNQNGELTWGSFEDVEGFTLEPNIAKDKCKTETNTSSSGNSKLIYIILIILIIAAIIFVALKGKSKNNSKKDDDDDTEEDNYNYNYRV